VSAALPPPKTLMEALAITIFVSLALAVFFVAMFFFSQRESRRSIEQEALLPFDDGPPPPRAQGETEAGR
jgi:cbb3-type cytochrome oxidase subunit 3